MQQLNIEAIFVLADELLEGRLSMGCEQLDPCGRDRLMVDLRRSEMRGVSLNAFPNQQESFIERLSVEQKPSQPQVISVPEQRWRQYAIGECREEFVITEFIRSNDDRHAGNSNKLARLDAVMQAKPLTGGSTL